MIKAEAIFFGTKDNPILQNINLEVKPGSLVALLGANGAGKTTLLHLLSGDYRLTYGSINYNGRSISKYSANELASVRAVLPQHSSLQFDLSVQEVVGLGRMMLKDSATSDQQIIDEVLEETGIRHFASRRYSSLSGGEQQRVHLARVLAQLGGSASHPRFLLLDEPTASLDYAFQHRLLETVSRLKEKNIGILTIIHDLNMASAYADEIIFLKAGNLIASGKLKDVFTAEQIESVYDYPVEVFNRNHDLYALSRRTQAG